MLTIERKKMNKIIIFVAIFFLLSSMKKEENDLIGNYKNDQTEFIFQGNGDFYYRDIYHYESALYTFGWSKGKWINKDKKIYLESEKTEPLEFTFSNDSIYCEGNKTINFIFNRNIYFELFIVNEITNVKTNLNDSNNKCKIKNGKYHFEIKSRACVLKEQMNINIEKFNSRTFEINDNSSIYNVDINFNISYFSFVNFKNTILEINNNSFIYNKNKFKKANDSKFQDVSDILLMYVIEPKNYQIK